MKTIWKYSFNVSQGEADNVRLVCESTQIPGLLHIFAPEQMELVHVDE